MSCVLVDFSIIGKHVRAYRRERHMTQEILAERTGISKQFLSSLERGKGIPSVQTLMSLCNALELTPNDLLLYSSRYDPDAPCTLRDDHSVFTITLDEKLFPQQEFVYYISLDDLPSFDAILPDTEFDPK
ncbi:MAG: helix-turn-helix transcriptional regulator [Clostridia bacterium]|nr:helix-turn-helix transcriptional regulator [Clostridia bacterium]